MLDRRTFVAAGLAAAASCATAAPVARPVAKKHLLILGGTGFLGPHQVRCALARGHRVTVFNRGRSGKGMFGPDVEELVGDRNGDLSALQGRGFDAVIDESASQSSAPEWVQRSTELLRERTEQYLFVSTRSVYLDTAAVPMTTAAPVVTRENSPVPEGRPLGYGHAKAYAEKAAHAAMPGRVTVVRPGLIIGPEDDTDRFTWWPVRIARGGEMMAPGDGSDHVQNIDVRDLAEFQLRLVEDRTFGVFNAVGPDGGQTFRRFLERIRAGVGGNAEFTWVDVDFLLERGLQPYGRELPGFRPMRGSTAGFGRFDLSREIAAGLTFRPTETTARDTLAWWNTLPAERTAAIKTGLGAERERELLAAWRARAGR
ncbi:MAG: NAD-dependent epimerase/dehydratase family protein [Planctomycetes bacterium]|jgi:2'-hydroxyisoflavone reductase|nr:NAD-dependent epimerase/dehydratase family protein [Planctomycetota bacterium]